MNQDISLIERAIRIAISAHGDQVRRNDGSPYFIHPLMVGFKLEKHGFSDTVVAAGIAHDILEDTDVTEDELREILGDDVVDIVTVVSHDDSLSWDDKKKGYVEQLRNAPEEAKAVSVADKIHNAESMVVTYKEIGGDIWKKFKRSKERKMWFEDMVLSMLKETWDHPMVDEYALLVEEMRNMEE